MMRYQACYAGSRFVRWSVLWDDESLAVWGRRSYLARRRYSAMGAGSQDTEPERLNRVHINPESRRGSPRSTEYGATEMYDWRQERGGNMGTMEAGPNSAASQRARALKTAMAVARAQWIPISIFVLAVVSTVAGYREGKRLGYLAGFSDGAIDQLKKDDARREAEPSTERPTTAVVQPTRVPDPVPSAPQPDPDELRREGAVAALQELRKKIIAMPSESPEVPQVVTISKFDPEPADAIGSIWCTGIVHNYSDRPANVEILLKALGAGGVVVNSNETYTAPHPIPPFSDANFRSYVSNRGVEIDRVSADVELR